MNQAKRNLEKHINIRDAVTDLMRHWGDDLSDVIEALCEEFAKADQSLWVKYELIEYLPNDKHPNEEHKTYTRAPARHILNEVDKNGWENGKVKLTYDQNGFGQEDISPEQAAKLPQKPGLGVYEYAGKKQARRMETVLVIREI